MMNVGEAPSFRQLLYLPIKTEQKKYVMGILTIGADMFKNQLGVMGKNLRKSKKKKRQSWLTSIYEETEHKGLLLINMKEYFKPCCSSLH